MNRKRISSHHSRPLVGVILSAVLLTACVTPEPPLYRWGEYEDILYSGYKNGGSDPVNDAIRLSEDMARTEAEGQNVPPGVRIQLAYMYFAQGRNNEAKALLEEERAVFPASTTFVNGLLARMGAS